MRGPHRRGAHIQVHSEQCTCTTAVHLTARGRPMGYRSAFARTVPLAVTALPATVLRDATPAPLPIRPSRVAGTLISGHHTARAGAASDATSRAEASRTAHRPQLRRRRPAGPAGLRPLSAMSPYGSSLSTMFPPTRSDHLLPYGARPPPTVVRRGNIMYCKVAL